jgi:hypothetical protein
MEKCMFLVYSGVILEYIVSKGGKLLDLKKISTIMNIPTLKMPKDIMFSMGWPSFTNVSSRT